jgi:hypothetical protein
LAIADLNRVNEKLKIFKSEVLNTKIFVNSSGKCSGSSDECFSEYISAKCQVLQLLEDNVSLGLKECESIKNQKKDAKVEKKDLDLPENTKFQKIIMATLLFQPVLLTKNMKNSYLIHLRRILKYFYCNALLHIQRHIRMRK